MNDEVKASCLQFIVHRSYFIVPHPPGGFYGEN
jgi:hypothetical protein